MATVWFLTLFSCHHHYMTQTTLNLISTFSALLPITVGATLIIKAGYPHRLLLFLILYGFLTDVLVGYLYLHNYTLISQFLFNIYSPVECILFCLILHSILSSSAEKKFISIFAIISIAVWLYLNVDFNPLKWHDTFLNAYYVTIYQMIIACLAASVLLQLTQQQHAMATLPIFWLSLGVFIYCFCTFVVNGLVQTNALEEIWWLHNIINIIATLIFTQAFLTIKKQTPIKN